MKVSKVSIAVVLAVSMFGLAGCVAGPAGPKGPAGPAGATGATGPAGAKGATGAAGSDGTDGAPGTPGATGAKGAAGTKGSTGARGLRGLPGAPGAPGAPGVPGAAAVPEYAYVYNLPSEIVPVEGTVDFSDNGVMTAAFSHLPLSDTITINEAGDYAVWFSIYGQEPNQMALFDNGALVPGSIYGSGAGTQPNSGMIILAAAAGDALTLRNHSSASLVFLQTVAGGTQANSNASILIQKLG